MEHSVSTEHPAQNLDKDVGNTTQSSNEVHEAKDNPCMTDLVHFEAVVKFSE